MVHEVTHSALIYSNRKAATVTAAIHMVNWWMRPMNTLFMPYCPRIMGGGTWDLLLINTSWEIIHCYGFHSLLLDIRQCVDGTIWVKLRDDRFLSFISLFNNRWHCPDCRRHKMREQPDQNVQLKAPHHHHPPPLPPIDSIYTLFSEGWTSENV